MKQGKSLREAKAERAEKKKRAKRRKRVIVLLVEILILMALLGIGYMMWKDGKIKLNIFNRGQGDVTKNEGINLEGYTTIALFGTDSRTGELEEGTHADTIMLVSIDNDSREVRVASVYRDLIIKRPDGELGKASSSYFYGGPQEMINMLNQNFDLNIERYVTVNFVEMANVVDALGGVEIDVQDEEAEEINKHIDETGTIVGKSSKSVESGLQILDGVQAVTYARIQKNVGRDYARTERQRVMIQKLAEKAKKSKLETVNKAIKAVVPSISTNITVDEMIELASAIFEYKFGETDSYAFEYEEENVEAVGNVVIPIGVIDNVERLHAFLYPGEEYTVTETAKAIAQEIEAAIGRAEEDAGE